MESYGGQTNGKLKMENGKLYRCAWIVSLVVLVALVELGKGVIIEFRW